MNTEEEIWQYMGIRVDNYKKEYHWNTPNGIKVFKKGLGMQAWQIGKSFKAKVSKDGETTTLHGKPMWDIESKNYIETDRWISLNKSAQLEYDTITQAKNNYAKDNQLDKAIETLQRYYKLSPVRYKNALLNYIISKILS